MNQPTDPGIIDFIHQQVSEGVWNAKQMKRHIKLYVKNELCKYRQGPGTTNKMFYLPNVSIRIHIYHTTVRLRFSKIDQVNLDKKIEGWKRLHPTDFFLFHKCSAVKSNKHLENEFKTADENVIATDEVNI